MKILGIDPGYDILGWSIIEDSLDLIDYGIIKTQPAASIEERLLHIHTDLTALLELHRPDSAAIEKIYFSKNSRTVINVSKAIGVIILTLRLQGIKYHEYTPLQVKKAITGFGRADKEQMQRMIQLLFKIKQVPHPDDAADALAIAACHSMNYKATLTP